jgi:ketosteroid isomerase-like protein
MSRVPTVASIVALAAVAVAIAQAKPDLQAARAAIMKADEAFNQSAAARDREAFLALIADQATFGGGTPNELRGKDAIWKAWARFFDPKGPTLTWHPTHADVLSGGDVGYTTGFSELRAPDGRINRGQYLTVWRQQADRSWKVVFDTGSAVPGP